MTAKVGNSSATDANSYTTASITPTANTLILVWITSQLLAGPAAPTLSGNSLTYVQVNSRVQGTQRTTLFRAMGATPSAGAITIDFTGVTQSRCAWSVVEFGNVDTGGTHGSAAVVQSAVDSNAGATSLTVTLAAFGSANNATASGGMHRTTEATTPGAGFTEIHDVTIAAESHGMASEWRVDNDTTADMSWTTSSACSAVAVEIAEAVAAGGAIAFRRTLLGVGP